MLPMLDAMVESLLNMWLDRLVMTAVSAAPLMFGGLNRTMESGVARSFPSVGPVRCCSGEFRFNIRARLTILLKACGCTCIVNGCATDLGVLVVLNKLPLSTMLHSILAPE